MKNDKTRSYIIYRHQKKATAIEGSLRQFGWVQDNGLHRTSAAFLDVDVLNRVETIDTFVDTYGIKIFTYPHAARPNVVYAWKDCVAHPKTTATFVGTECHAEVLRRIGYPHPIHPIGWMYCEKREFQPVKQIRNVLFGPIHPNSNGWLCKTDVEINQKAFSRLVDASHKMGFHLTVRYLHDLSKNGLRHVENGNITYIQGSPDNSFYEIDRADLVVGHQTFAWIAVARGKPTLMMDEWIAPRAGNSEQAFAFINKWDLIKDLLMYPLDINAVPEAHVEDLLRHASGTDEVISDWRSRMIGPSYDGKRFMNILKGYFPEFQ